MTIRFIYDWNETYVVDFFFIESNWIEYKLSWLNCECVLCMVCMKFRIETPEWMNERNKKKIEWQPNWSKKKLFFSFKQIRWHENNWYAHHHHHTNEQYSSESFGENNNNNNNGMIIIKEKKDKTKKRKCDQSWFTHTHTFYKFFHYVYI